MITMKSLFYFYIIKDGIDSYAYFKVTPMQHIIIVKIIKTKIDIPTTEYTKHAMISNLSFEFPEIQHSIHVA